MRGVELKHPVQTNPTFTVSISFPSSVSLYSKTPLDFNTDTQISVGSFCFHGHVKSPHIITQIRVMMVTMLSLIRASFRQSSTLCSTCFVDGNISSALVSLQPFVQHPLLFSSVVLDLFDCAQHSEKLQSDSHQGFCPGENHCDTAAAAESSHV